MKTIIYFVNHPRMGLVDESFAADSIGEKYIMSPQEIEDALGWTVGGQIKGYATGLRRRPARIDTRSRSTCSQHYGISQNSRRPGIADAARAISRSAQLLINISITLVCIRKAKC